jgi:hypothetical protein
MEMTEDQAEIKARENITMYLNRGGINQGDIPQYLSSVHFHNTFGFAMGLTPNLPTSIEQASAEKRRILLLFW